MLVFKTLSRRGCGLFWQIFSKDSGRVSFVFENIPHPSLTCLWSEPCWSPKAEEPKRSCHNDGVRRVSAHSASASSCVSGVSPQNRLLPGLVLVHSSQITQDRVYSITETKLPKYLTPWSTALPEKLTVPQLVRKFIAFYGVRRFIAAFKTARHLSPILSHIHSVHAPTPLF